MSAARTLSGLVLMLGLVAGGLAAGDLAAAPAAAGCPAAPADETGARFDAPAPDATLPRAAAGEHRVLPAMLASAAAAPRARRTCSAPRAPHTASPRAATLYLIHCSLLC